MRSLNRAATIANLRERPGRRTRRTLGARPAISVREGREEMPELVALRAQVLPVRIGRGNLDRHALGDVQAVALEPDDLLRVVGEEPEVLHPEVHENLGADPVITQVRLEAQRGVGLDRVLDGDKGKAVAQGRPRSWGTRAIPPSSSRTSQMTPAG